MPGMYLDSLMMPPKPQPRSLRYLVQSPMQPPPLSPDEMMMQRRDALMQNRPPRDEKLMGNRDAMLRNKKVQQLEAQKAELQRQLDEYLIQMEDNNAR